MLRPWQLIVEIKENSPIPVFVQIARAIIDDIRRGRLEPGSAMPGTRTFAKSLGVNRKTILAVYEELIAQGWLCTDSTRGTFVSSDLPVQEPVALKPTAKSAEIELIGSGIDIRQDLMDIPKLSPQHGVLAFNDGTPDSRLVPFDQISRAVRRGLQRAARRTEFGYGDPRGNFALRQAVSTMLNIERGQSTTPNNICITRGSQMAIYLCGQLLIEPGDIVLVGELNYPPARITFQQAGANVLPIPLDENGVQVEKIEEICRTRQVKAIYLTPHHQFPTTVSLSSSRRVELITLAERHGLTIIEDDYDHEFHFEHRPLLPLASAAPQSVVYIGSLSKLLSPGLRIGYIAAPTNFIEAVAGRVMLIDRQGNPGIEIAVSEMIDDGEMRRHARKSRSEYARRRDVFKTCMAEAFGDDVDFTVPNGGLALWVRFRKGCDLARMEAVSLEHGVQFLSSRNYTDQQEKPDGLRLGFASLSEAELKSATERLHSAYLASRG